MAKPPPGLSTVRGQMPAGCCQAGKCPGLSALPGTRSCPLPGPLCSTAGRPGQCREGHLGSPHTAPLVPLNPDLQYSSPVGDGPREGSRESRGPSGTHCPTVAPSVSSALALPLQ
ncbi:hypothetical protein KIL84_019432 [Mauremys mutica]|nr:hypothetical protein KIL84_019432 [Mauremys mutica]